MKTTFSDGMIDAAVKYWAKHLASEAGVLPHTRTTLKTDGERIKTFEIRLRVLLRDLPESTFGCWAPNWVDLDANHTIQGILRTAAREAGISALAFPLRTKMRLKDGEITVNEEVIYKEEA